MSYYHDYGNAERAMDAAMIRLKRPCARCGEDYNDHCHNDGDPPICVKPNRNGDGGNVFLPVRPPLK